MSYSALVFTQQKIVEIVAESLLRFLQMLGVLVFRRCNSVCGFQLASGNIEYRSASLAGSGEMTDRLVTGSGFLRRTITVASLERVAAENEVPVAVWI